MAANKLTTFSQNAIKKALESMKSIQSAFSKKGQPVQVSLSTTPQKDTYVAMVATPVKDDLFSKAKKVVTNATSSIIRQIDKGIAENEAVIIDVMAGEDWKAEKKNRETFKLRDSYQSTLTPEEKKIRAYKQGKGYAIPEGASLSEINAITTTLIRTPIKPTAKAKMEIVKIEPEEEEDNQIDLKLLFKAKL